MNNLTVVGRLRYGLIAILGLGLAGVCIASYLTYAHYQPQSLVCAVGNCKAVQESSYSTVGSIPVAIFGLGMYLAILLLTILRLVRYEASSFENATIASWSILLAGTVYAGYLTYVEIWVIDAICQWCVASAIVTAALLAVESILLYNVIRVERLFDATE